MRFCSIFFNYFLVCCCVDVAGPHSLVNVEHLILFGRLWPMADDSDEEAVSIEDLCSFSLQQSKFLFI